VVDLEAKLSASQASERAAMDYSIKLQQIIEDLCHARTPIRHADLHHSQMAAKCADELAAAVERSLEIEACCAEAYICYQQAEPSDDQLYQAMKAWTTRNPKASALLDELTRLRAIIDEYCPDAIVCSRCKWPVKAGGTCKCNEAAAAAEAAKEPT
ncbi:MAG: hypothetical protein IMZ71_03345, partial [Chloroflexi bacterium]|nr:hypothetical protein [Chloroflexota bacterium]